MRLLFGLQKNKKQYIYTVVTGMQKITRPMRRDEIALKPNLVESEIVPEDYMLWSYCLTIQSVDQQCLKSQQATLLAFVLGNKSTKTFILAFPFGLHYFRDRWTNEKKGSQLQGDNWHPSRETN